MLPECQTWPHAQTSLPGDTNPDKNSLVNRRSLRQSQNTVLKICESIHIQ